MPAVRTLFCRRALPEMSTNAVTWRSAQSRKEEQGERRYLKVYDPDFGDRAFQTLNQYLNACFMRQTPYT
jgi:hypothetical protein